MKKFFTALILVFCLSCTMGCGENDQAAYDRGYAAGVEAGQKLRAEELDKAATEAAADVSEEGYVAAAANGTNWDNVPTAELTTKVWYTSGGQFYHQESCANIKDSPTKARHNINAALEAGRQPCPDCMYPPTTATNPIESQEPVASSSQPEQWEQRETTQGVTVYITDTGGKYHRSGCHHLRYSCHDIDINEAERLGYTSCSHCW